MVETVPPTDDAGVWCCTCNVHYEHWSMWKNSFQIYDLQTENAWERSKKISGKCNYRPYRLILIGRQITSHYVPRIDSIHRWPDRLSNHSQFSFIFFLWNFVKQSNEHWDLFLVVNKLERLIWLDNHCLTLNQPRGKKIGWMLMGIFLPTEVNWGNQSHRQKKIEQKNEEKRQNKTE